MTNVSEALTERSAVVVVDMLNDFCSDGGAMVVPAAADLYAPINALTAGAVDRGATVIWACDRHQLGDREFDKRPPHCLDGTWGAAVVPELERRPVDLVVPKRRFSAFFATDLDLLLRERRIDTLVVTGVMTNICVRATVHDAFFHGYRVVVPEDCVGALAEREQRSTLDDVDSCFGTVCQSADLLRA